MPLPKRALALVVAVAAGVAGAAAGVAAGGCGESNVERGDRLSRQHRWLEAVDAYERALARYPHDYDAAWGIARIYCLETHLPDKCLAWTDRLLAAYPDRVEYRRAAAQGWRDRAAAYRRDGDAAAAEAADAKARELDPP